jgi:hypothetical protein
MRKYVLDRLPSFTSLCLFAPRATGSSRRRQSSSIPLKMERVSPHNAFNIPQSIRESRRENPTLVLLTTRSQSSEGGKTPCSGPRCGKQGFWSVRSLLENGLDVRPGGNDDLNARPLPRSAVHRDVPPHEIHALLECAQADPARIAVVEP